MICETMEEQNKCFFKILQSVPSCESHWEWVDLSCNIVAYVSPLTLFPGMSVALVVLHWSTNPSAVLPPWYQCEKTASFRPLGSYTGRPPINCQTNCVAAEESGGTLIVESQALVIHICSLLQALFGLISTFELGHVISSSISLVQLSL